MAKAKAKTQNATRRVSSKAKTVRPVRKKAQPRSNQRTTGRSSKVEQTADFEAAVWRIANAEARRLGYTFDVNCEQDFRSLVRGSLARVGADPLPLSPTVRQNTKALVAAMVDEARRGGATKLHEWTLQGALGKLCPLFPFC